MGASCFSCTLADGPHVSGGFWGFLLEELFGRCWDWRHGASGRWALAVWWGLGTVSMYDLHFGPCFQQFLHRRIPIPTTLSFSHEIGKLRPCRWPIGLLLVRRWRLHQAPSGTRCATTHGTRSGNLSSSRFGTRFGTRSIPFRVLDDVRDLIADLVPDRPPNLVQNLGQNL